ncbi:MAG: hypothetical protein ACI8UZ_001134, partial [Akkermansiaceae bacterium]
SPTIPSSTSADKKEPGWENPQPGSEVFWEGA